MQELLTLGLVSGATNVLMNADGVCKLCDMGIAKVTPGLASYAR